MKTKQPCTCPVRGGEAELFGGLPGICNRKVVSARSTPIHRLVLWEVSDTWRMPGPPVSCRVATFHLCSILAVDDEVTSFLEATNKQTNKQTCDTTPGNRGKVAVGSVDE